VAEVFLCGAVEAGLELFCNSWSAGFLRERLYSRSPENFALQQLYDLVLGGHLSKAI